VNRNLRLSLGVDPVEPEDTFEGVRRSAGGGLVGLVSLDEDEELAEYPFKGMLEGA
jgi:hypothetical protein